MSCLFKHWSNPVGGPHSLLTAASAPKDVEHAVRRRREAHAGSCRGRAGNPEGCPHVAGRAEAVEVVEVESRCNEKASWDSGEFDH